jgi:hypothetical protein
MDEMQRGHPADRTRDRRISAVEETETMIRYERVPRPLRVFLAIWWLLSLARLR